jgi:GT2 family glycosyltransferase
MPPDPSARATIVIAPRERWSFARQSLADILAHTRPPYDLIYTFGAGPQALRRELAALVVAKGFRFVDVTGPFSPNRARNEGAKLVQTEYTVFVDNDIVVEDGWLERLVACADETKAWIVGPLVCIGWPPGRTIHMAGGLARIGDEAGERRLTEEHLFFEESRAEIAPSLRRGPAEQTEFHCMLVRSEALARLGYLDEELPSIAEHTDLCMQVRDAGGGVWLEPSAIVTYVPTRLLRPEDRKFYDARWSDERNRRSVERFAEKWRLGPGDPWRREMVEWGAHHRLRAHPRTWLLRALLGAKRGYALSHRLERS